VIQPDTVLSTFYFPGLCMSERFLLPSSSAPSLPQFQFLTFTSQAAWHYLELLKGTVQEEPNIQGIIYLKPISILSCVLSSIHTAKIAFAWRWKLMDNWEGMVNRGHRTKYYLRAQYAVTQMTFLQGNDDISLRANEWCATFPQLNCSLIETKHKIACKDF